MVIAPSTWWAPCVVEVLSNYGTVLVRNSKIPSDFITFTEEEWEQFLEEVKRGDYDS